MYIIHWERWNSATQRWEKEVRRSVNLTDELDKLGFNRSSSTQRLISVVELDDNEEEG
jgi:hypothetical protein